MRISDLPPHAPPQGTKTKTAGCEPTVSTNEKLDLTEIVREFNKPWREATMLDLFAANALAMMTSSESYPDADPERVALAAFNVGLEMLITRHKALATLKDWLQAEYSEI